MDKLWQESGAERATSDPALLIDVAGFEGPLDLLLYLARNQKVDLSRISVLALAEQYLQFIESARRIRIELAADYLVMAAWLAYLKSRLLIPQQVKDDGPSGEEMAATLAFRLKRLEAMRQVADGLVNRNRLGRDIFARGAPEHIPHRQQSAYEANLYELLSQMIGDIVDWTALEQYLLRYLASPAERVTAVASAFAASLELVREGKL